MDKCKQLFLFGQEKKPIYAFHVFVYKRNYRLLKINKWPTNRRRRDHPTYPVVYALIQRYLSHKLHQLYNIAS